MYIYDFSQKEWRKYNDGYVTLVKDHKEIYDKELGSRPATPYFLVYVRGDVEEQLADAVCRRPVEPPPYTQDVVMEEAIPSVEFEHKENVNGGYASEKIAGAIGGWDSSRSAQLANW